MLALNRRTVIVPMEKVMIFVVTYGPADDNLFTYGNGDSNNKYGDRMMQLCYKAPKISVAAVWLLHKE
jgi:hypothetical protein